MTDCGRVSKSIDLLSAEETEWPQPFLLVDSQSVASNGLEATSFGILLVGPLVCLRPVAVCAPVTKVALLRSQTPPQAVAQVHETTPNQNLIVLISVSLDPSATSCCC